jgi:hypothetical protein
VHPGYFTSYRSGFLDMMLASYLPNIVRMEIDKCGLPQGKKQIEVK